MRSRVGLVLVVLGLAMVVIASPAAAGAPLPSADLAITKSDTPDPVVAGGTVSYAVVVENLGPDAATGVSWTDTYPVQLSPGLMGWPAGWTQSTLGNTVTFTASAPLAADGPRNFLLEFTVSPSVPDGTILTNDATVTASTADPTPGNNSASAQTTVVMPPPTPAASLADAAMAPSEPSGPLTSLGFAVLLFGALGALAVMSGRRVLPRR
ncbi:MAG TPA: DUF11 domain-containing protein [Candidatus Limnocylindria bacterium]|jgi:uncharacterized repeat protein (TIGR01451 family)|nr:DUF11 domain-containing protein [Candidatus Limnocylindria bacterium]